MKKHNRMTFFCCLTACFILLFPGGARALTREEKCTTCYEILV